MTRGRGGGQELGSSIPGGLGTGRGRAGGVGGLVWGRRRGTDGAGRDSAEGSWCEKGAEWLGRLLRERQGEKGSAGTSGGWGNGG